MAITVWLDKISDVWAEVPSHKDGLKVRSYYAFKKAEFPESLSIFPCVLSYIPRIPSVEYSRGGPNVVLWSGVSEFHIFPNISKANYPNLMVYFERIIIAAAKNLQLGGIVEHFVLEKSEPIVPGVLRYGNDDQHLGLVVRWQVKEIITLTVSV